MKLARIIALLIIVPALIVGSCGKSSPNGKPTQPAANTTSPAGGAPAAGYIEIVASSRNFNPDSVTIKVGTTVNWTSRDGELHTVTSDIPDLLNGTLLPFDSYAYTFNTSGDYEYFCSIHGQMGMRGVIHVR